MSPRRTKVAALTRDWMLALSAQERTQFLETLEDAKSDLQRELLERGLRAGRTVEALHAMADTIRPLPDDVLIARCHPEPEELGNPAAFQERLRQEADPLWALTERDEALRAPRPSVERSAITDLGFGHSRRGGGESSVMESSAVGRTAVPVEDLLNPEVSTLGLRYKQEVVDRDGLSLEAALPLAAAALDQGHPVPILLGKRMGDLRAAGLILQLERAGNRRVFQLYDLTEGVSTWVAEADLVGRRELPALPPEHRRITAVFLPSTRS